MQIESARARAMDDTRKRILDLALEALGQNRDAGMGDLAYAAVFSIADSGLSSESPGADAATITSPLILGVPAARARALSSRRPAAGISPAHPGRHGRGPGVFHLWKNLL